MELKEFIKSALIDILDGVAEAQQEVKHGKIAPKSSTAVSVVNTGFSSMQGIDFEVTVATEESAGREAKLNVVAAIVGGGVKGNSNEAASHVARLSFRVPITYEPKILNGSESVGE